MFDYTPMTEEQAQKERYHLLEDGEYDAVAVKVTHRISPAQNNMFEIDWHVFDKSGQPVEVKDFLVFTNKMMWKVIHCADSCGILKEYEDKKFTPELLQGQHSRVLVSQQKGNPIPSDKLRGKPEGTCYPDKNVIYDYVKMENQKKLFKDDQDIPF